MVENQLWGFFLSCQVPSDLVNLHDFLIGPFSSAVALGHSLEETYQAWTKSLLRYRLPFRWGVAVPLGQEGSSLTRTNWPRLSVFCWRKQTYMVLGAGASECPGLDGSCWRNEMGCQGGKMSVWRVHYAWGQWIVRNEECGVLGLGLRSCNPPQAVLGVLWSYYCWVFASLPLKCYSHISVRPSVLRIPRISDLMGINLVSISTFQGVG